MDWTRRSEAAELIDSPDLIPASRMAAMLRELRLVNRYLGGISACLKVAKPVLLQLAACRSRPIRIADWGTGSADIPRALLDWAGVQRLDLQVIALDFNLEACRVAKRELSEYSDRYRVVAGDVERSPLNMGRVDLVLFSAFLHHFSQRQIIRVLSECRRAGAAYAIINDLHRSRMALAGISILSRLFSRSPEVRHDGPLSVRKGFRRNDLKQLAAGCGCRDYRIRWQWAFRYTMQLKFETNRSNDVMN